ALKFTEAGHVWLHVEPKQAGETTLRFEVRDTGIGIAKSGLGRLFRPFMQAEDTTRRFGGTGLGLAISKQIVDAAGGRIGAASEPGRGSCFWFELDWPAREAVESASPELGDAGVVIQASSPALRETLTGYFSGW